MFPSLGVKVEVPAAVNAAATSLWSASAAVKQKPASSAVTETVPAADTSTDEAGKTFGRQEEKGRGSSSASSKTEICPHKRVAKVAQVCMLKNR